MLKKLSDVEFKHLEQEVLKLGDEITDVHVRFNNAFLLYKAEIKRREIIERENSYKTA